MLQEGDMQKKINKKGLRKINPKKGIIVSYPRNGLNWVRYCIEHFSGLRTAGQTKIHTTGKLAVYRSHNVLYPGTRDSCYCAFYNYQGEPIHDRMLLLVRDYRESFIRVWKHQRGTVPTAEEIRSGKILNFRDYFENLKAYDKFPKKKLIVRYKDLIEDFSEIEEILRFFGIDYDLENFDLEYHRQKSIQMYDKIHTAYSKDNVKNFTFHQDEVGDDVILAIDQFVDCNYRWLVKKYLT